MSLLEIKKKMNGVKSTRKITKAMQLVAASKMRQFQKKAVSARDFVWDLLKILENNIEGDKLSVYAQKRSGKKVLFVLYTSDKGLCGPLNTKLINAVFRSEKWKNLKEDERVLVTIGKKASTYAQSNKVPVLDNFDGLAEKVDSLEAIRVVDVILKAWREDEEISEVVFIAPHYKNSFTFYPVMKTFLPFSKEGIKTNFKVEDEEMPKADPEPENLSMLFSPEQEDVLKSLYEQVVLAMFIQGFLELKASEYSSRMIAMQNATDAADEMIATLKQTFNKARQQAITQEIAELIGASMALAEE